MVEPMMIDLKALLVEREDCDAGTVQQLRNGLAQGGTQYRTLRDVTEVLKKKLEARHRRRGQDAGTSSSASPRSSSATPAEAVEHLKQAEGALANFYLGRALASRSEYDEALKAFEKAEKLGYTASQVQLQRAGIYRQKGDLDQARTILTKLEDQASHNAEYHFQLASCYLAEGERPQADQAPGAGRRARPRPHRRPVPARPRQRPGRQRRRGHPYYERCLKHPPVHVGMLKNLGVLYEDHEKYDKAVECYRRVLAADPTDEQARLFLQGRPGVADDVLQPGGGARLQPLQPGAGNPGHRLRAVGAQPELPEEDEHPHARRPDARQRAAAAQQQELRRNVAERDQGDDDAQGPAPGPIAGGGRPARDALSGRSSR